MKYTNITKYAYMALFLAIILPTTAQAAEPTDKNQLPLITEEQIMNDVTGKVSSDITTKLDGTGKIAYYTINIANVNEDLKGVFYLLDGSNLENLGVLTDENISADSVKTEDITGGKKITVDLKNVKTINLRANIKEGKENNFVFDYILANNSESKIASKRVVSAIETDAQGYKNLKTQDISGLESLINGKFIDESNIEWSDFLVNQSDKDISINYPINLSENQKNPGKIKIETLRASKDGFVSEQTFDLDFGDIQNLIIPANGATKITFNSLVNSKENTFSANQVEVKRDLDVSESDDVAQLTNTIAANDLKIKEQLKAIDKDVATQTKEAPKIDTQANNDVDALTNEIKERNEQILSQMKEIDKDQAVASSENKNTTNESQDVNIVVLKDETSDKVTRNLLTSNSQEDIDNVDIEALRLDIENRNTEILNTLQEIDKEYPSLITLANNTNTSYEKSSDITSLIKEIEDRNQTIQDELVNIYGKYAANTVMDLSKSIDDETYKLLTHIDKNNEKTSKIIDQINLSIESNKALDNKEELANIKALLDNIDKLEKNNEKALQKVDDAKVIRETSESFKNLVPGYSENVYNDLEKVVTITLDPLNKTANTVTNEQAHKNYPTIAKYLEDLKLLQEFQK